MDIARIASLVAATLTTGLMAGLFFAFDVSVMPALRRSDDRTVVAVMQRVNVAILNGWFLLGYVGALAFTAAAVALHVPADGRGALPPLIGALVCYGAAVAVTARVNIPLNDALEQAGPVERIADPAAVRAAFERPWSRANVWRTVLCTAALGFLAWALLCEGRLV